MLSKCMALATAVCLMVAIVSVSVKAEAMIIHPKQQQLINLEEDKNNTNYDLKEQKGGSGSDNLLLILGVVIVSGAIIAFAMRDNSR